MRERSKELLIAELPQTNQGKIDYYFHGKRQMREAHKLIDKMDFLCQHLETALGDELVNAVSKRKVSDE